MKALIFLLTICFLGSGAAFAQVDTSVMATPTAQPNSGLAYAFRYAQTAQFSSVEPTLQTSDISGTLGYVSRNPRYPFAMNYGGGYIWTLSGPAYMTGQFHRMDLNQGINFKRWKINLDDDVSYLPQSPTVGFSGIPGIGEIIGSPNPVTASGQTILTASTHVLDNLVTGDIEHTLNYATTVDVGGNYELLRFPDVSAIESDTTSGYAQLGRRLSGRTTMFGRATYTLFSFTGTPISINTGTAELGVQHNWTRSLTTSLSAGPQQLKSSISLLIPSAMSYAVNASLDYQRRYSRLNGSYSHGTEAGSGYLYGGTADVGEGTYLHQFGPNTQLGFAGGYNRTAGLIGSGVTNSEYGGVQVTWRLASNFIVFANYTATNQTTSSLLSSTALNDLQHFIGFGFGLSSREVRPRP
jgi:hypothetical protein